MSPNLRIATLLPPIPQKSNGSRATRGSARPPHAALLGAEHCCLASLVTEAGERERGRETTTHRCSERRRHVHRTHNNNIDDALLVKGGNTHRDSLIKMNWRLTFLSCDPAAIAGREANSDPTETFLWGVNKAGEAGRPTLSLVHTHTNTHATNKLRGTRRQGRAPAAPASPRPPSRRIPSCGPKRAACSPDREARRSICFYDEGLGMGGDR